MLQSDMEISDIKTPLVHRANTRGRSLTRRHYEAAAASIGVLTPGCELLVLSNGQYSLIDAIETVLRQIGPARMDIATWTAAAGDLRRAERLLENGAISGARFMIDPSFRSRKPEFCAALVDVFGVDCLRTIRIHAKFVTLRSDDGKWNIAIRTSMNLNPNPRMELIEISDDAALCDFLGGVVDEVFASDAAGANLDDQTHSRFQRSAGSGTLDFDAPLAGI